ncbi:glycoside hydrolase family 3 C-terminal domain-containing protein [Streptomyces olindensis]|uniref:glycoside hydrolase family 3 C-terminal domain-containing protein n=1 Tax=Streptomyces olindensis TaxID=358823 RepID=UPI0033D75CF8
MSSHDPGLTLDEKTSLLSGHDMWTSKPVEHAGIPGLVLADGPHGLRYQQGDAGDHMGVHDSAPATCLPPAVALASSWDPQLVGRAGETLGHEARAHGVNVLLGPGVNIKRSPLCGRNFEYFSEDPLVAGVLGAAYITGLQSTGVGACVKHFAANNQETDRMRVSADVDERTLREIYLPAFERVVTQAQPASVMAAYNKVNGVHATQHHWLLTQVLRDEWGFDGLVVSDWGGVQDRVAAVAAGCDLEMPGTGGRTDRQVADAVRSGELDEAVVDRVVARLRALIEATGSSDEKPVIDFAAHHIVARELAADCLVLLKNDRDVLPLTAPASLAVIGEFARSLRYQGGGSSHVNAAMVDEPLAELRALLPEARIAYAQGFDTSGAGDASALRAEAVAAASKAEVAVVYAGLAEVDESEGFDRRHILLPAEQVELIKAVAAAARRTVVVLLNGGVVSLEGWHDDVDAIVEAWLPGQAGGGAIADVLTGRVNPSGRLTETIPFRLNDTPSVVNFPGEAGHVRYGEGVMVGYRYYETYDVAVRYPFGHGLSYTRFAHDDLELADVTADTAIVRLRVTNIGERFGKDVVQVYVSAPQRPVSTPARELRGFAKVALDPGESTVVEIPLDRRAFAYYDITEGEWTVARGTYRVQVGRSAHEIEAEAEVELPGDAREHPPALTLDSTVGEWFSHPVVGEAFTETLTAGSTDEEAEKSWKNPAIRAMASHMTLRLLLVYLPEPIPDERLDELMALSTQRATTTS